MRGILHIVVATVALALMGLGGPSWSEAPVAEITKSPAQSAELEVAVRFVQLTGVNKNFKMMLKQATAATTTIRGLAAAHGSEEVFAVLDREIDNAIQKYGVQWDRYFATAYLEHFTPEELESILELKRESPYAQKFRSSYSIVGGTMKGLSEPLLHQTLTEILLAVFQSFAPEDKK